MKSLDPEKIPKPEFDYAGFKKWLAKPHKKFVIEIGCGVGFHPIQWAKKNPDSKILAIERTTEKFEKFEGRVRNHPDLKNIFIAHADAAVLLPHLLPAKKPLQVDAYIVLYPNPYPKSRHKNRRFAFHPLTKFMAQTLKARGTLTIATNIAEYADEIRAEIPTQTGLLLSSDEIISPGQSPRSHFEKKYLLRGETCHNLVFARPTPTFAPEHS